MALSVAARSERGIALLHVLLLLIMVAAVSAGAALLARTGLLVADFHRSEQDAAQGAQAVLAVALQDLDRTSDWNAVLSGTQQAGFADGPVSATRVFPGGATLDVCCAAGSLTDRARAASGISWRPFGWQSLRALLGVPEAPPHYVVAWVADDADDPDSHPETDANGRLLVRAESVAVPGARRAVEALVERGPRDPATGAYPPGLKVLSWREAQ